MATLYSEIYDLYSGMTSDWEFLSLPVQDQDNILEGWLLNSVGIFDKCKTDLFDRDNTLKQFNQTLKDSEKTILARLMIVEWLSPKLYNLENLRNSLNSRDFESFSPANLLKEIRTTQNEARIFVNGLIVSYGYKNTDLSKL